MPIYEYQCTECQLKFEALRSMKDADVIIKCRNCGSEQTRRLLSVCQTHVTGGDSASRGGGCSGCSGGSCGSCGH